MDLVDMDEGAPRSAVSKAKEKTRRAVVVSQQASESKPEQGAERRDGGDDVKIQDTKRGTTDANMDDD